jgi:hypothetical protein
MGRFQEMLANSLFIPVEMSVLKTNYINLQVSLLCDSGMKLGP